MYFPVIADDSHNLLGKEIFLKEVGSCTQARAYWTWILPAQ